jgi:hypothetical protein
VRRLDPSCRLRGWQTLATAVDREIDQLRRQGIEPIVACGDWAHPAELAFYCHTQPAVYSVGVALGCRHSQYDLWRPNPVTDPEPFLGRTFLFVGIPSPLPRLSAFDEIGPTMEVHYEEAGVPVACWQLTVCRGFRGFPIDVGQNQRY